MTDIALPVGASPDPELNNDWQPDGDRTYRVVWSPDFDDINGIVTACVQWDDGSIDTDENPPVVYIMGTDFHPDDARSIAKSIIEAADLADRWAGQ